MALWIVALTALVSTGSCIFLWFRDVRRIMRERKSIVESASGQFVACREKALRARGDPKAAALLERSEGIYRQAIHIYNQTLQRPWNYLPAHLMGFREIS